MLHEGGPLQDKCSLRLWQSGCKSGRRMALAVLLGAGPTGTVVQVVFRCLCCWYR